MAEDVVIRAEGLGKKYVLGHREERESYVALRDILARNANHGLRKAADVMRGRMKANAGTREEFWALRGVDFEVRHGEVLGIIGRNGAGKSTLLKILSRITDPSEGRVTINGRVASLLEVGTGFHPELTGRENIFLNGAILGMTRAEIKRKFDEIVAFAEIEKFLDTPVKRYSSGMYVRLAFAVAAHLEPEILIVDEVLAVGDAEFQKKSLGKMSEVASGGRTVLFVSHNMPAIASFCSAALSLERGKVVSSGLPAQVLSGYLGNRELATQFEGTHFDAQVDIQKTEERSPAITLRFDFALRGPLHNPRVAIGLNDAQGHRIATVFSEAAASIPDIGAGQVQIITIETEPVRLSPGKLLIKLVLTERDKDVEIHEEAFRVIVPEYTPFSNPARRPNGPIFLTAKLTLCEEAYAR